MAGQLGDQLAVEGAQLGAMVSAQPLDLLPRRLDGGLHGMEVLLLRLVGLVDQRREPIVELSPQLLGLRRDLVELLLHQLA